MWYTSNDIVIGDLGLIYLSNNIVKLPNLQKLLISDFSITDKGHNYFFNTCKKLTSLKKLLYNVPITDDGLDTLTKNFKYLTNLEFLLIKNTEGNAIGMSDFCSNISTLRSLKNICLASIFNLFF